MADKAVPSWYSIGYDRFHNKDCPRCGGAYFRKWNLAYPDCVYECDDCGAAMGRDEAIGK